MSPSKAWLLSRLCLGLSVTLTCRCSSKQLPSSPRGLPCRSRNRHGRHGRPRSCRCCRRARLLPQPAAPQSRFCRTDCSPQPRFRLWVQGLRQRGQWVRAAAPRPLPPERAQAPARRAVVAGSSVGRRYCGRPLRALPAHGRPLALPLLPAQPHRSHWERLHRDAPHLGQVRRRGRRQPVHSRSGKRVSPCGTTQPPPVQAQARAARSCCALDPSSRSPRRALALQFFLAWSPGR